MPDHYIKTMNKEATMIGFNTETVEYFDHSAKTGYLRATLRLEELAAAAPAGEFVRVISMQEIIRYGQPTIMLTYDRVHAA